MTKAPEVGRKLITSLRSASLSRPAYRLLLALLLAVGLAVPTAVMAVPTPAQAQSNIVFFNGFEGIGAFGWTFHAAGGAGNSAFVEVNSPNPRTGSNNGALLAHDGGSAAFQRSVDVSGVGNRFCYGEVYVQTNGGGWIIATISDANGQTQMSESYQLQSTGTAYERVLILPTWRAPTMPNVMLGIVLVAPGGQSSWVRVDDTAVSCGGSFS